LSSSIASGVITFDPKTGAAKLSDWHTNGSGSPPTAYVLSSESATGTYSNTATTLTLGSETFEVTYGAMTGGIATYLSYIGVVVGLNNDSCADLATLMRQ
jgi:hypothetical protein